MTDRGWSAWEHDVQEALGLDSTIHSGSKFYDPGDAVTRGRQSPFPLYADCKFTESHSRSLKLRELLDCTEAATELGKRMIMPLRFWPKSLVGPQDYVVIRLHDFIELLDLRNQ